MINRFLKILFPEFCPVCKKPSTDHRTAPICSECWQSISSYKGSICKKCGKPLVSDISTTCKICIEEEPAFKWVRSFGLYEDTLKEAINLLKYYRIKRLSKPLSEIMLKTEPAPEKSWRGVRIPHADAIIPVPLHKKRLRQRGFNQSALLAKYLARHIGVPLSLDCLVKIRDTMPQVGLNAKERKKNIRKAFEISNKKLIRGKNIVLVDDVFTTGTTVRECSKILKKSGAKDIYVLTLAHSRGD